MAHAAVRGARARRAATTSIAGTRLAWARLHMEAARVDGSHAPAVRYLKIEGVVVDVKALEVTQRGRRADLRRAHVAPVAEQRDERRDGVRLRDDRAVLRGLRAPRARLTRSGSSSGLRAARGTPYARRGPGLVTHRSRSARVASRCARRMVEDAPGLAGRTTGRPQRGKSRFRTVGAAGEQYAIGRVGVLSRVARIATCRCG